MSQSASRAAERSGSFCRVFTAATGVAGLFGNMMTVSLIAIPILIIPAPAHASGCTLSPSTANTTYNYTAANLGSAAPISFSTTMTCPNSAGNGVNWCGGSSFTATVVSGANSMMYNLNFTDTTNGKTYSNLNSAQMYGPDGPGGSGASATNVTVTVTVPSGQASGKPAGTYSRAFPYHVDMTGSTNGCDAYGANTPDSATANYTVNYAIPSICSLVSTPLVDFGNISSIGPTTARIDGQGTVTFNCNAPYTVYIDDGNNRIAAGSGNRQMANGAARLPYQLYKDSNRTQIWDATGGTAALNGSGGQSGTGSGGNISLIVYGAIPIGTSLPSMTGRYSDTVIVTVTY